MKKTYYCLLPLLYCYSAEANRLEAAARNYSASLSKVGLLMIGGGVGLAAAFFASQQPEKGKSALKYAGVGAFGLIAAEPVIEWMRSIIG